MFLYFQFIGYRQLSSDRGYRKLSSERCYRQLSIDRGYRQLSNDQGYRQLSCDQGWYEYDNNSAALYAYDNPASSNNDIVGDGSPLFTRSRYQGGGDRNPTFSLDPSESYHLKQYQQQATTSLSYPYLRRAGDYSNYFLQDTSSPAEVLKRPSTLEVHIVYFETYITVEFLNLNFGFKVLISYLLV